MVSTTSGRGRVGEQPAPWADRIGRALSALCAVSAVVAFAGGLPLVAAAADEHVVTEFWRTVGYLVFAGLWGLLAWAPRRQRGVWELVLLHKVPMTVFGLVHLDVPGGVDAAVVDGSLVVVTVVAWVLCRGWLTWRPAPA